MADTTIDMVIPDLKASDRGDGTYAVACAHVIVPAGGTDRYWEIGPKNNPIRVKAIDLGDGTYAVPIVLQ